MKRFLIRIKMFNKTEIDIFVDSNSIETVMGFLEQEFIDNIQPMLTVHDVYKIVHMINKSKIHQITVAEKTKCHLYGRNDGAWKCTKEQPRRLWKLFVIKFEDGAY